MIRFKCFKILYAFEKCSKYVLVLVLIRDLRYICDEDAEYLPARLT